jgi:hypothetical protein
MCYHTLYLFLACGHAIPSFAPLAHERSPPCPARSRALFRRPGLASPIVAPQCSDEVSDEVLAEGVFAEGVLPEGVLADGCGEKLSHPLHTYRIAGLCLRCLREREERLARFEVGSIRDEVEREGEVALDGGAWGRHRQGRDEGKGKVNVASPGLRSGYMEGRGRGRMLERTGDGDLVDGRAEVEADFPAEGKVAVVAEAMGWDPQMGAFEGRRSGSWAERDKA